MNEIDRAADLMMKEQVKALKSYIQIREKHVDRILKRLREAAGKAHMLGIVRQELDECVREAYEDGCAPSARESIRNRES